ncbi:MAG: sigma-70 family RNA polymerase sigma factor [Planctomycetaceae bacterium]
MQDWPQIIENFGPVVWKQALRMLGNESDAADCFQTVIMEAYELSQREQVQSWPALLKRLATLRSIDFLRSRYRRRTESLPEVELGDPSSQHATESIDNQNLAEHLRREIALLPTDQAEAFSLRWIDGLPNEEVARSMNMTTNHAAVLIHRARVTLRDKLTRQQEQ